MNLHTFLGGQPDVIARFLLHPTQNLLFIPAQIDYQGAPGLDGLRAGTKTVWGSWLNVPPAYSLNPFQLQTGPARA